MRGEFGADREAKLLECQQAREKALSNHVGRFLPTHTHTGTRAHLISQAHTHCVATNTLQRHPRTAKATYRTTLRAHKHRLPPVLILSLEL